VGVGEKDVIVIRVRERINTVGVGEEVAELRPAMRFLAVNGFLRIRADDPQEASEGKF
jgi:hypothetical protein